MLIPEAQQCQSLYLKEGDNKQLLGSYDFVLDHIAGQGTIKILDKVQLNRVLLITNTNNEPNINFFSDPDNQISLVCQKLPMGRIQIFLGKQL